MRQINPGLCGPILLIILLILFIYFTYYNITYNLRNGSILCLPSTHSTYYGTNSVLFRGSLIWNNLARDIKSSKSVSEYKSKIKNFGNIDCGCVICS